MMVQKFLLNALKIWLQMASYAYWGHTSYGPFDKYVSNFFVCHFNASMVSPFTSEKSILV